MAKKRKSVPCAFCGVVCTPTKEHVLARWAAKKIPDYRRIGTVMKTHRVGQDPTLLDVCKGCNGGILSVLDETAKDWWVASDDATKPVIPVPHGTLARWLGKFVYNTQRLERREHGSIFGPAVPAEFISWIMSWSQAGDHIAVCVSVYPEKYIGARHCLIAGQDGSVDRPVWLIGLHRFFFCVAWDNPIGRGNAREDLTMACGRLPAVLLDLAGAGGAINIPVLTDPDSVYEALRRGAGAAHDDIPEPVNEFETLGS